MTTPRKAEGSNTKKRVLVVEDDPDAREIYSATLSHAGFDVVTAGTLKAAAACVLERKPDVVVLDCRLPDGNGLELLARWKGSRAMAKTPVVVVTAFSEPEHVETAKLAGADAFMVKPCPFDALAAFLDRLLVASAPTTRIPRVRTPVGIEAPEVVFQFGRPANAATLHCLDGNRYQARCGACMRSSPVLVGTLETAMRRAIDLGWKNEEAVWTCPVCLERARTGLRRRPA